MSSRKVQATGSTTARTLKDIAADVVNVKSFGAKCDGTTNDAPAIQAAIDSLTFGGTIQLPRGVCRIASTVTLANKRSVSLIGMGAGHELGWGTVIRWSGAAGGTMLDLQGWAHGKIAQLTLDGSPTASMGAGFNASAAGPGDTSAFAGVGIRVRKGSSVVSQKNAFEHIYILRCQTGLYVGAPDDITQGNNDQTTCYDCNFRYNGTSVYITQNQAVHWQFVNLQIIYSTYGVQTGSIDPNGGGFSVFGGAFAWNAYDFDLPRISEPVQIIGLRSEESTTFLRSENASGDPRRWIILQGVWQNSGGADSVIFRSGNSLELRDSHFVGALKFDNQYGPDAGVPIRNLIGSSYASLVQEGPTFAYLVWEAGTPQRNGTAPPPVSFGTSLVGASGFQHIETSARPTCNMTLRATLWVDRTVTGDPLYQCKPSLGSNLLSDGSTFAGGSWVNSGVTVTEPLGGGSRLLAAGSNSLYQTVTLSAASDYEFSFEARSNGGTEATYRVVCQTTGATIVPVTSYRSILPTDGSTFRYFGVPFNTGTCTSVSVYVSNSAGLNIFAKNAQVRAVTMAWSALAYAP
jgi:hypothetical protein